MKAKKFPRGWDESRVSKLLSHYEAQTDEEGVAEDEAAFENEAEVVTGVPRDLVPAIRELIAKPQR